MAVPKPSPLANAPGGPPAPPKDLSGVCFRNQWFLDAVRGFLSVANVFDYFAGSPFYDPNCSNEQLRLRGVHPLDPSQLKTMVGWEFALHEAKEPLLFVLKKQKRDSPDKVTVSILYYVLDGSVYQAPTAHAIITSRVSRSLHHLNHAVDGLRKLLKGKPGSTEKRPGPEPLTSASVTDPLQAARMDVIIRSALQRLPPAPVPKLLEPALAQNPQTPGAPSGPGEGLGQGEKGEQGEGDARGSAAEETVLPEETMAQEHRPLAGGPAKRQKRSS